MFDICLLIFFFRLASHYFIFSTEKSLLHFHVIIFFLFGLQSFLLSLHLDDSLRLLFVEKDTEICVLNILGMLFLKKKKKYWVCISTNFLLDKYGSSSINFRNLQAWRFLFWQNEFGKCNILGSTFFEQQRS